MLKDYLLDDLSSCSSSGFRSYPRRQCCTTVRFLIEIDLKKNKYQPPPPPPPRMYKKNAKPLLKRSTTNQSSTVSAFQRASVAVIKAVKHLPFAAAAAKSSPLTSSSSSGSKNKKIKTLLPRSFSRKLKRSFWKRGGDRKEIYWWTSFNRLDKDESKLSILSPSVTTITTITTTGGDSNSSTTWNSSTTSDHSNRKGNSWSESDFTASESSLRSSDKSEVINSADTKNDVVVVSSKRVGVTAGNDSPDSTTSSHGSTTNSPNAKKHWPNEEEKEQFSPVSVLDCPFDDEDEVSSPFQHRLARMEGTTKKLMKKIRRFECLTQLEPLNLDKRIASSESESGSPVTNSSESETDEEEEADKETDETKALDMVEELKTTMPSYSLNLNADKLLLDLFREIKISEACGHPKVVASGGAFDNETLQVAKDWINGKPVELLSDWKVQENRLAYIRDMENRGEWKNLDMEKQDVVMELEFEVFASLMNELLLDIISSC